MWTNIHYLTHKIDAKSDNSRISKRISTCEVDP